MTICTLCFLYLVYVLFTIQVVEHEENLKARTLQNSYNQNNTKRGTIYATLKNGDLVSMAEDETWYKLVISPKNIDQTYETRLYKLINDIVPLDRDKFYDKVADKNDVYEELQTITKADAEKVESLGLTGVFTYVNYKRVYPLDSVGGRIVGFVGGGSDGYVGRYGLEKYYNNDLSSEGSANATFFSKIFTIDSNDDAITNSSKDIVTTLEPNVMSFLHKELQNMKEEWAADEVSAIVMNPKTGEIIAMETLPEFNPNKYNEENIKNFGNPSVQGVYELGSIMKPITMSGGIEEGLVTRDTVFHDYGFIKIDNYTIKNFDEKVRGDVTMQDVISQSLNTGAVYVQKLLGKEKFKDYFNKFGFEDETGIDFPGEVISKTSNLNYDTDVNFATASFGQGVAITPISMLAALSVIPNDGKNACPHFLSKKILADSSSIPYICEYETMQVISTTTVRTMNEMLVTLIDEGLAKGKYKDKNYKVGAKTGTAQLPSPDGKYYKDKFIHSYFTYFPAEDPKFSVLIYQVNPKKGLLASLTLAPAASKIKDFLLTYYNIPPDRN